MTTTSPKTGWIETINHDVLPKLQALVIQADGLATLVYVVAWLTLVGLAMQAVWLVRRPPARGGTGWGATALALVLALPPAIVFEAIQPPGVGHPLLGPVQLVNVLLAPVHALWVGYDLSLVYTPELRLPLAATLALLVLLLVVVLARAGRWHRLLRRAAMVIALCASVYPVGYLGQATASSVVQARAQAQGQALFEARCQAAGAKRMRAGLSAEGIRLTRVRGEADDTRLADAQWPGAGIPRDRVGEAYIASFLDFEYFDTADHPGWNSDFLNGRVTMSGFQFVDVEQGDGRFRRYRLVAGSPDGGMVSEELPAVAAARIAVSYTPTDTPQERAHWVAGALVAVSDTETGEVLGELRTAAFAPPSRKAFADPQHRNWGRALTCPAWNDVPDAMARLFAAEVVRPLRAR